MARFTNNISQAAKDVRSGQDTLVDILERIDTFFQRLEFYAEVPPDQRMMNTIATIMVEALFILTIATEEIRQGRASTCYCTDMSPTHR